MNFRSALCTHMATLFVVAFATPDCECTWYSSYTLADDRILTGQTCGPTSRTPGRTERQQVKHAGLGSWRQPGATCIVERKDRNSTSCVAFNRTVARTTVPPPVLASFDSLLTVNTASAPGLSSPLGSASDSSGDPALLLPVERVAARLAACNASFT